MGVTLRDVAARAGVSIRTVSNVVNDFHHVSPATRAKVRKALDELDYRPNLLARSLKQGRTGFVTLLVPEITASYFAELAHRLVEVAGEFGMTVVIDETGGRRRRELELLDVVGRSRWVDGILFTPIGLTPRDIADMRPGVPVVLLGERSAARNADTVPTAGLRFDHAGFDNVAASRAAVRHLIDCGRTRIAALGGTAHPSDATTRLRLKGYRQELRAARLAERGCHAATDVYSRAAGAAAVRRLWTSAALPDALFCLNDDLAAGALRELSAAGVKVPQDVSVVGFDDVEQSSYLTPALSSIALDNRALARAALQLLVDRIQGDDGAPRDVRVGHRLVVRESSRC
jgi:DNA-binding LacI/PurR family transcriptional regulator